MITYDELNEQNHRITELANVLRYLFEDRAMCDTGCSCDLFSQYVDLVHKHIETVDKEMYSELLRSPDQKTNNVARNFMSGSSEVKRILRSFTKSWCTTKKNGQLMIGDHAGFIKDTNEMFDIVLQRIQDETEHLYPMVRSLQRAA